MLVAGCPSTVNAGLLMAEDFVELRYKHNKERGEGNAPINSPENTVKYRVKLVQNSRLFESPVVTVYNKKYVFNPKYMLKSNVSSGLSYFRS